ncbi:hypothetical protein D3C72_1692220 [compost metagenome]
MHLYHLADHHVVGAVAQFEDMHQLAFELYRHIDDARRLDAHRGGRGEADQFDLVYAGRVLRHAQVHLFDIRLVDHVDDELAGRPHVDQRVLFLALLGALVGADAEHQHRRIDADVVEGAEGGCVRPQRSIGGNQGDGAGDDGAGQQFVLIGPAQLAGVKAHRLLSRGCAACVTAHGVVLQVCGDCRLPWSTIAY